jgi:hypothetical protein
VANVQRLYSLLLHAYPARLRTDFGGEMVQLFADQLGDARERHKTGRFYVRTFADWLRTVPAEHYSEYRRRAVADRPLTPVHRLLRRGLVFAPNPSAAILITAGVLAWRCVRKLQRRSHA